ncbi:MAG: PAS domain-containing sensor histidine kinase [Chitinophagaceae bacterium]|nr:PAS domain-containing sensor histidine kinase [Polaromonas sp.]
MAKRQSDESHSWFGPEGAGASAWDDKRDLDSFDRLWRAFMTARVTIACVLIVLQGFVYAIGHTSYAVSVAVCVAYLAATLAVRVWARPIPPGKTLDAQWVSTIGVDVVAFSVLNYLQSGNINYTPLFALPVLLASVLGPLLLALGTAASVTLLLLTDAWLTSIQSGGEFASRFIQSGLSGSGFFAVALLANQLALRLAREEQLAKTSQSVARMQTQVNELVIESLAAGVLVMDINGIVRSANPASRRLLATQEAPRMAPFVLAGEAAWQPLASLMRQTFQSRVPQEASVALAHAGRTMQRLQVRTRLATSPGSGQESLCVMFLEDLREMEAKVRVEKMAAMGRMSAAVAHEIRNPLAAIVQANALLEEDLHDAGHRKLTAMVSQNAKRLGKIVDEVLDISRAKQITPEQHGSVLALDEAVARITADWAQQNGATRIISTSLGTVRCKVAFDPEHLRRVMINLLDNAFRYASKNTRAIQVTTLLLEPDHARLAVWSDGTSLEKTVQTHLFEPFFSSESRSSGLGLYICRELCERYGAAIGYQRLDQLVGPGNEFFVVFKPPVSLADSPSSSFGDLFA